MLHFSKSLAKYYIKWFDDCHESAIYCRARGREKQAQDYLHEAEQFLTIIMENWDAIEYFSVGDRAGLLDSVHPAEFRGYR